MRLFAALELPEEIRDAMLEWWYEAGRYLDQALWREVPAQLWHVTLAFYGEVDGQDVDDLAEELMECAAIGATLDLQFAGVGVFPNPARPKVFWAGVDEMYGGHHLRHLARCCRRAGHVTVRKLLAKEAPFRGHVTMARYQGHGLALPDRVWEAMPELPELTWRASQVCLFQSILRPEGPQYRRLETFTLAARGIDAHRMKE
jgi:RNA 2',3'-cyclic 3'-phosphodiesterase